MSKYTVKATSQFRKDYKLAKKRGKNTKLLDEIIKKLAGGDEELEKAFFDTTGASEDSVLPQYQRAVLVNYVEENKLDITAYQEPGWDPVSLTD